MHEPLPEGRAVGRCSGRLTLGVCRWRILGMRVALGFHSATLELYVDHLANGIEQLHTVVEKVEVFLMTFLGVVIVLPFHAISLLNRYQIFVLSEHSFIFVAYDIAKLGSDGQSDLANPAKILAPSDIFHFAHLAFSDILCF